MCQAPSSLRYCRARSWGPPTTPLEPQSTSVGEGIRVHVDQQVVEVLRVHLDAVFTLAAHDERRGP